jgi:hypothetical protein
MHPGRNGIESFVMDDSQAFAMSEVDTLRAEFTLMLATQRQELMHKIIKLTEKVDSLSKFPRGSAVSPMAAANIRAILSSPAVSGPEPEPEPLPESVDNPADALLTFFNEAAAPQSAARTALSPIANNVMSRIIPAPAASPASAAKRLACKAARAVASPTTAFFAGFGGR